MLLALAGPAGVGKDTVAKILGEHFGVQRVAFADALKALALLADPLVSSDPSFINTTNHNRLSHLVAEVGWEEAKKVSEVRSFLQRLGIGAREVFGQDFWVEQVNASLEQQEGSRVEIAGDIHGRYVITDCRFENEAKYVKYHKGQVWKIERPGFGPVNGHVSEVALAGWDYDLTIENSGTLAELEAKVVKAYGALTV